MHFNLSQILKRQSCPNTTPTHTLDQSTMNFHGKVALVTGGSKGIGRAVCLALAEVGASVVVNYSSDASAAEEVVKCIASGPGKAVAIKADVSSVAGVEDLVSRTVSQFGKIDVLIANAGVLPMKDLKNTTEADWDSTFALNVKGPYFLAQVRKSLYSSDFVFRHNGNLADMLASQKAAPHMPKGSHIVFTSTTLCAASTVTPPYLLYNSTKGAIEQMTKVLAKDLGRPDAGGILVNCVAPGPTGTDLFYKGKSEQLVNTIANFNPQARIGTPEEIAEAVLFLAGSSWTNGQILRVNGGMA